MTFDSFPLLDKEVLEPHTGQCGNVARNAGKGNTINLDKRQK